MNIKNNTLLIESYLNQRFENQYNEYNGISDNLKLKDSIKVINFNGKNYAVIHRVSFLIDLSMLIRDFTLLGFDVVNKDRNIVELSVDYKNLKLIYKTDEILSKNVLKKELK